MLLLGYTPPAAAEDPCEGVQIYPGNDLDAIVNGDSRSRATTFCVHAGPSGTTYTVNNTVMIKPGDKLIGQPGQVITRGPASYGVPPVKIRDGASLENVIELAGPNVELKWLDIAGGEVGIGAYGANASSLMHYLTIHDNTRSGIANMRGKLLHSDLYNNGTNRTFWGYNAAAAKGITGYVAAYNYVHNNPADGLWCDVGCPSGSAESPNGGYWVHHNLLVNNGRWGVHYEHSAKGLDPGVHQSQPTALIEYNEIHGNGYQGRYGGANMFDAQNGVIRNNVFGAKTIAGVSYRANNKRAILFGDSGKASRTDLWNGDAVGNTLGGESIVNCEKPDSVVYCANNR